MLRPALRSIVAGGSRRSRVFACPPHPVLTSPLPQTPTAPSGIADEGSLRPVTVLFADIRGFTRLSQALPAEAVLAAVNDCFEALDRTISRYGGAVDKFLGDGVMAVFGARAAHEDDPRRAVLAALEMQAVLGQVNRRLRAEIGTELEMRIGINTGVVVTGPVGSSRNRSFSVIGDAVNVASRLERAAPVGSIVIGESTRAHLGRSFRLRPRRSVRIRGRDGTLRSYVVLGQVSAARRPEGSAHVVGRAAELARLSQALRAVRGGQGAVTYIRGGVGVGKSRLIQAARRSHVGRGVFWIEITCPAYGDNLPYAALATLIQRALAQLSHAEPGFGLAEALAADDRGGGGLDADLVAGVVNGLLLHPRRVEGDATQGLPPQLRKGFLARATKALLRACARYCPTAVVLDDCQWLDTASEAIVAEAMTDLHDGPIGWILASRDDWTPPRAWAEFSRIDLRPLDDTAALRLARELLAGSDSEGRAAFVVERAEGNPLYIVEMCRQLVDTGEATLETDVSDRASASGYLSDRLRSLVLSRADALDGQARHLLEVAAVLGPSFPEVLLREVLGPGEWTTVMGRLNDRGFLVRSAGGRPDGGRSPFWWWRFSQPLLQETLYQSKLAVTRRRLHRTAGLALEQLPDEAVTDRLALLALHFARGDDRERAVRYLHAAGDRARGLYLNREAVDYYDEALARLGAEGPERGERARILAARGDALAVMGRDDEAIESFTAALELEQDPEQRAAVLWQMATIQLRHYQLARARGLLDEAEESLRDRVPGLVLGRVWVAEAMLATGSGQSARARSLGEQALALLEGIGAPPEELAKAFGALGTASAATGDLPGATAALRDALRAARAGRDALGAAQVAASLAGVLRRQGSLEEAVALYRESLEFGERVGARYSAAMASQDLGDVLWEQGETDEAVAAWDLALQRLSELGNWRAAVELLDRQIPRLRERGLDELADRRGERLAELRAAAQEAVAAPRVQPADEGPLSSSSAGGADRAARRLR